MKYLSTILLLATVCHVYAFDNLQKGIAVSSGNLNHLAYSNMDYAVADFVLLDEDPGVVIGFYRENGKNELFAISSGLFLYKTDFAARKVASVRPLTRWPNEYIEDEYKEHLANYPTSEITKYEYHSMHASDGLGCYAVTPLRYGDIDEDGQKEIVLFLMDDMVVFSPQQEKIVFSVLLSIADWERVDESDEYVSERIEDGVDVPQYISSKARANIYGIRDFAEGHRGYAKLYFGDFDENGQYDILVWRKLYRSHMRSEATQGFYKINDTWLHYEKTEGTYTQQNTVSVDIQQWLADKQQTWKTGFPTASECASEEGAPILEMHDPLLNDPEVLQ